MAINLVDRVTKILTAPGKEWDVIASEPANAQDIALTYALPLIGISQLMAALGLILFYQLPVDQALVVFLINVAFHFAIAFALAGITDTLAPNFGADKNFGQSFKLVYAMTPIWIAGILAIVPKLSTIVLLVGGLWALLLIFIGLPKVKKPKKDQEAVYAIAVIGAIVIVTIVAYMVIQQVAATL